MEDKEKIISMVESINNPKMLENLTLYIEEYINYYSSQKTEED